MPNKTTYIKKKIMRSIFVVCLVVSLGVSAMDMPLPLKNALVELGEV